MSRGPVASRSSSAPMTMVVCREDSLSDQFVAALGNAETYAIADGQLTITDATGGTLVFK